MPEVSFGSPSGATTVPTLETQATVTPDPAPGAVGVPAVVAPVGVPAPTGFGLGDNIPDFKDIIMPRINLVQNTGILKDSFPSGALIHGQSLIIFEPTLIDAKTNTVKKKGSLPVNMVVCGKRPTRFVEKLPGGDRGAICNTEEEVRAMGGTTDYKEWNLKKADGMRRFEFMSDMLVLVERPEICTDDGNTFIYDIDGKKYALALWAMKGSAYTAVVKKVINTNRILGYLRDGIATVQFQVSSRTEKAPEGNSTYWNPVFVPGPKTSPAILDFIKSFLTQPAQ
jgi:hypothetical protein